MSKKVNFWKGSLAFILNICILVFFVNVFILFIKLTEVFYPEIPLLMKILGIIGGLSLIGLSATKRWI